MNIGLLAVSFGTTHLDTLERTILAAEADLSAAFPQLPCYRAFTSAVVRRRLAGRMAVDGVEEALARVPVLDGPGLDEILEADRAARQAVYQSVR